MQAGRGRQQLNNSTGSLRKALFAGLAKPKNLSAGVYTSAPSKSSNSGWNPIFNKKRKRNDTTAGVLGVPTVLAASGAVVQRGRTARPTQSTMGGSAPGEKRRGMSLMDQLREPAASMIPAPNRGGVDQRVHHTSPAARKRLCTLPACELSVIECPNSLLLLLLLLFACLSSGLRFSLETGSQSSAQRPRR